MAASTHEGCAENAITSSFLSIDIPNQCGAVAAVSINNDEQSSIIKDEPTDEFSRSGAEKDDHDPLALDEEAATRDCSHCAAETIIPDTFEKVYCKTELLDEEFDVTINHVPVQQQLEVKKSVKRRRRSGKSSLQNDPIKKKNKCEICGKTFKNDQNNKLVAHIRNVHEGAKDYSCYYCEKRYSQKCHLKDHVRNKHIPGFENLQKKERSYICDYCGKGFPLKKCVKAHIVPVHLNLCEFGCKLCGKWFSRKGTLTRHTQSVHEKKYAECEYCDKTYARQDRLKEHVRLTHVEKILEFPLNTSI